MSAERAVRTLAHLARESAAGALLIADLAGDAALLGAWQPPGRSGHARELRGPCGGRSAFAGEGVTLLLAVVAEPSAWLPGERGAPLTGARLLNRLVRGVLAGLTPIGVAASYPGRDFVAAGGRRVAQLSLTRTDGGAFVFQCALGRARSFTTEEPEPVFPGLPPLPEAGALEVTADALAAALARGFESRFGLELEERALSAEEEREAAARELPALFDPELAGTRAGSEVAVPIGRIAAHAALDLAGRFARVRFRGDWIAAPADVRALEESLAGLEPLEPRVRELCARWLAETNRLVVGVTDPESLVEALQSAAEAASQSS